MIQYAIYDAPGGNLLADYTHKARGVTLNTNTRGFADCAAHIPLLLPDAFAWHDQPGLPHVELTDNGLTVWEGRLEDPTIDTRGLNAGALGYNRALLDLPYTALWSKTTTDGFRPMLNSEVSTTFPDRFAFNTQNRLYIAPQKNAVLGTTTTSKFGALCYQASDDQSRGITGIAFDWRLVSPAANWRGLCRSRNADFTGIANVLIVTSAGSGVQAGSFATTITSAQVIDFAMDFNAADAAFAGETGSAYWEITNLRLTSSVANAVSTTFTANRAAGTNVTATVGSTARMYVGQRLYVSNAAGTSGESVLVLSIGSSTQFNATFSQSYVIADTVRALVIYADEIASDLVAAVNATNSAQLSASTALIQSPGFDLTDEVYEDEYGADILDALIDRGDTQTPPRRWEWSVWEGGRLTFQPRNSGRTWYVDITDLEVVRTLEALADSVYATYTEASGRVLRAATSTNAQSVAKYGVTRQQAAHASTTNVTQAQIHRDTVLNDQQDPLPQARITFDAVYDAFGTRHLLHEVRATDLCVIRNLPPTLSTAIDRIRTFRITRTELDLDTNTLTVEPEAPLPTLEAQLAAVPLAKQPTKRGPIGSGGF